MNSTAPECPSCRMRMEEGHVLGKDRSGQFVQPRWVEGEPEKALFHGFHVKGKRQYLTISWRCPRCGWLLWFAPGEDG
jgi:hypothetical protein